jgi:NADH-quinone oxidoreductase subunit A
MVSEGYAANWTAIILAVVIGVLAMGLMFAASRILAPRRPSAAKAIPYESGIVPTAFNWSQLNVRYYIFAILFLVFDVEAVFLFPWALVFLESAPAVFYEMLIFMAVLLGGLGYAWKKGALEWR